ncbi:unnamed protein product [Cylicocyclus nassatus]|uniref:Uncharacterized protein n=1 Tax=Cylicocyclus nassatus TaxID=53992 RepID=A0AA36HDV4_CYLNA|nr:unnamed protein product [Cylicocyclus nassatus]
MSRFSLVVFAIIGVVHTQQVYQNPKNSGYNGEVQKHVDEGKYHIEEAAKELYDKIIKMDNRRMNSMGNHMGRGGSAQRDKLKEMMAQSRPYLDETNANMRSEQELNELEGALTEAQSQLSQESGSVKRYNAEAEIARIRDEINRVRYGLKERLQNIMLGKKKPVAMASPRAHTVYPNYANTGYPSYPMYGYGDYRDYRSNATTWQTWTWILLGLSIILGLMLIGMLMWMMSKKRNYEQLYGTRQM